MKYTSFAAQGNPRSNMVRIGSQEVCLRVFGSLNFYAVHMRLSTSPTNYGSEAEFLDGWLSMNKTRKLP